MRKGAIALAAAAATMIIPAQATADSWSNELASWYGPGLYGNPLGCGGRLGPDSRVVASRTRPCGQHILVCWHSRCTRAVVADRGPYSGSRTMDLGPGVRRRLGFSGVHTVRVRLA